MVFDAHFIEHLRNLFGCFNIHRTDQNRLACFMHFSNLIDNGTEFSILMHIHHIFQVLTSNGFVGRNFNDIDMINFRKFIRLCQAGTGHTGQLFVHTEEVLERHGSQGLGFTLNRDPFLCLNGLMQTFRIATPFHNTTGEFINNLHLIVVNNVIDIAAHGRTRLQGLIDVVHQFHMRRIGNIIHMEIRFRFSIALFGQVGGLALFIHQIIDRL